LLEPEEGFRALRIGVLAEHVAANLLLGQDPDVGEHWIPKPAASGPEASSHIRWPVSVPYEALHKVENPRLPTNRQVDADHASGKRARETLTGTLRDLTIPPAFAMSTSFFQYAGSEKPACDAKCRSQRSETTRAPIPMALQEEMALLDPCRTLRENTERHQLRAGHESTRGSEENTPPTAWGGHTGR
jgi:hypothetical protein